MHTVRIAMGQVDVSNSGGIVKPLLMVATLPALICAFTIVNTMIQQGILYQTAPPQLDALFSVSSMAEAQSTPVQVKQYQVARVISPLASHSAHRIVTTQDGTRFVVLGTVAAQMRPGYTFSARTLPYPLHTKQHTVWLEEYSPDAVTDPKKLTFPETRY